MRLIQTVALVSLLFANIIPFSAYAQGTFENLDFESANIPPLTSIPSFVPISEAIPGWNANLIDISTSVSMPQTRVVYDGVSTGGAGISLIDMQAPYKQPLQGNYSMFLFGGGAPSVVAAEISQTGLIPSGTETLFMDAWESPNASPVVAVNGKPVSMIPLEAFANYTLYGGDISSYAGQTATLSFTDPPPTIQAPSQFLLDNIAFSPQSVPEPSPLALTGIGALLLALYRRFAPRRP